MTVAFFGALGIVSEVPLDDLGGLCRCSPRRRRRRRRHASSRSVPFFAALHPEAARRPRPCRVAAGPSPVRRRPGRTIAAGSGMPRAGGVSFMLPLALVLLQDSRVADCTLVDHHHRSARPAASLSSASARRDRRSSRRSPTAPAPATGEAQRIRSSCRAARRPASDPPWGRRARGRWSCRPAGQGTGELPSDGFFGLELKAPDGPLTLTAGAPDGLDPRTAIAIPARPRGTVNVWPPPRLEALATRAPAGFAAL